MSIEVAQIEIEKNIKGEVAYWSSIIETILIRILLVTQLKSGKDQYVKIYNVTFKDKIDRAFINLKIYYPDIWKRFEPLEDEMHQLREFRNLMIHCRFNWTPFNIDKFTVWDVSNEKDDKNKKMDFMTPISFEVQNVANSIQILKGFTLKFIVAAEEIDTDLREAYPEAFLGY